MQESIDYLRLRPAGTVCPTKLKLVGAGGSLVFVACLLSTLVIAQQNQFVAKPLAEKKVTQLPDGDLYWRIETFDAKPQAEQAAGPYSLVGEAHGKTWLFTLGRAGEPAKGVKVTEIGPIQRMQVKEYLLRVNEAGGPEGAVTSPHTHPGSEAFYVVSGELSQRSPHGTMKVSAGQSTPGHGADTPMIVSNSGKGELREFAMFVVDASRPFNSPAKMD
jgi:mannose-6-phosphate isomerase-like protein (cupin superfamily)